MKSTRLVFLLIGMTVAAASMAQQAKKDIFADPKNLKVLPEGVSSAELSDTMKGFAMGLGVRCETCHVGEPNMPLDTFDFESDEKAMKRKARVMIRMVTAINGEHVSRLDDVEVADRVEVRCVTCHRGQQRPELIQDVLDAQLAENGIEGAIGKYAELRENYYGSHSYDFSEFTLPMYAQELAEQARTQEAIALTKVNAGHFPDSYYTFFVLAELYASGGQAEAAVENYNKAIELNPQAKPFLESRIAALGESSGR